MTKLNWICSLEKAEGVFGFTKLKMSNFENTIIIINTTKYYLPKSSFWLKCFQDHSQETIVRIWKFLRLFIADAIIFPKASVVRHQAIKAQYTKKCRPDNLLGGSNLAVPPGEKRCSYILKYTSNVFLDILNTPSYIAVPAEHIALKSQRRYKILKRSKYFFLVLHFNGQ